MANINKKQIIESIIEFIRKKQEEQGWFQEFETDEEVEKVAEQLSYYIL